MAGNQSAGDQGPDQSQPRADHRHGKRLLTVALLGGALALLANEDFRNQMLDMLFGAEEEFDYSSITEPATPGGDQAGAAGEHPSTPWVRPPAQAAEQTPDAGGEQEPTDGAAAPAPAASEQPSDAATPAEDNPAAAAPPVWRISSTPDSDSDGAAPAGSTTPAIAPSPAAWQQAAESARNAESDDQPAGDQRKPDTEEPEEPLVRDWWLRDEEDIGPSADA
jgi:hypothetical protein